MNKKAYASKIIQSNTRTEYICPVCQEGYLNCIDKNITYVDYKSHNEELKKYEDYEAEWFKFAFHGILICDNQKCREEIVFAGKSNHEYNSFIHEPSGEFNYINIKHLDIEYIERAPNIIQLKEMYPPIVKEAIKESFKLFWIDMNSCANRIRVSLEELMNIQKIKRYPATGKRNKLPLHNRIIIFTDKHPQLKDALLSIKWIGNFASHTETITRNDLLDGYELLEYTMNFLYDNNEERIKKMAKTISSTKKPRSKQR